jgi:hypothetical protein
MKKTLHLFLFIICSWGLSQYPTKEQLINDVKTKGGKAFETITPVGDWGMFHDKVPKNKPADACAHEVDIKGPSKADGSYWTYKGKAIYHKVGNKFEFDRVFLYENDTRLNGLKIPGNDYFLNLLVNKIDEKDAIFVKMNFKIYNATAIYSMEMNETPKISGNSESQFAEYIVNFVLDLPNGNNVNKIILPVKVKAIKKENDFVILSARNENDGKVIETKNLKSPEEQKNLIRFKDSNKKLKEFMK